MNSMLSSTLTQMGCLFLALLTSACVEVVDESKPQDPVATTRAFESSSFDPWVQKTAYAWIRGVDWRPHVYCVAFRNGGRLQSITVNPLAPAVNLNVPIDQDCDALVLGGSRLDLYTPSGRESVEVPMDLEIERDLLLKTQDEKAEIKTSGRLFVQNAMVISTNGKPLLLKAHEIFFSNAAINTSALQAAESGQSGAPAGNIEVEAGRVVGSVYFKLSGQQGGAGAKGQTGAGPRSSEPFAMAKGGAGQAGFRGGSGGALIFRVLDASDLKIDFDVAGGAGGHGGAGGEGQSHDFETTCGYMHSCTGKPQITKGEVGEAGASGVPGSLGICREEGRQHGLCRL